MNRSDRSRAALGVAVLVLALGAGACEQHANEGRRMPKAPPPPSAPVDKALSIAVTIDGVPAPPVDAERLERTPATYADEGKRAWRIDTLFGAKGARTGVSYTVTGDGGVAIVLRPPRSLAEAVPVIAANLRGEVIVAMVSPGQPFPAYHGQGGRLGRRGDPLPRIGNVTSIAVAVGPVAPASQPAVPSTPPAP